MGDKSWSIDMQRYNFQFTGQRFFRIENGRLAGQLKDVAYQATTTDFWRSMEAVGGPETYLLGGAFNCGKGQPGQVAPVSHGSPSALFRGVNMLNTQAEGGGCVSQSRIAQELVERALSAATLPGVAAVSERTEANLRWANNALTTNGEMRSPTLTVTRDRRGRRRARRPAPSSQEVAGPDEVAGVVAAAEQAARTAPPRRTTRSPWWRTDPHGDDWAAEPETTDDRACWRDVASDLGRGLRRRPRPRASCCTGSPSTSSPRPTWAAAPDCAGAGCSRPVGWSSTPRPPTGAARPGSAGPPGTSPTSTWPPCTPSPAPGWAGRDAGSTLPPGRYETLLPPGPVADLMIYAYWTANARDAEEGRNVYAAGDGATQIGTRLSALPLTLSSDPAYPGLECAAVRRASPTARTSTSWTFDGGAPIEPVDLDEPAGCCAS